MSRRRVLFSLGAAAFLMAVLAFVSLARWRAEAPVRAYNSIAMGMSLDEVERILDVPRTEVFAAYVTYREVDRVEDSNVPNLSMPVMYRKGDYLVTINYDPTTPNRRVHCKQLERVEHERLREFRNWLP
jgi:hypothetical protein